MATGIQNVFTQATNFIDAIGGGVDPRTGVFTANIVLGQLTSNNGKGPDLPLILGYSPLNAVDAGFGIGFSLGMSVYDRRQRLLRLSSGQQYKVLETNGKIEVLQKKLVDLKISRHTEEVDGKDVTSYRLAHKSGVIEYLRGSSDENAIQVPHEIRSPIGDAIYFEWSLDYQVPRLNSIYDQLNGKDAPLVSFRYSADGGKITCHILPGRTEGYQVDLSLDNKYLRTVINRSLGDGQPLTWDLEYSPAGASGEWGKWLSKITSPGGKADRVVYSQVKGHEFPPMSRLPRLPYVTLRTQELSNGREISRSEYRYSSTNFVGGNSGLVWNPDSDNLYGLLTDYTYYSEETEIGSPRTRTTRRTYNRYHLLIEELVTQSQHKYRKTYEYYAQLAKAFDAQPAQFQFPASVKEEWTNPDGGTRSKLTLTTFDSYGNLLGRNVKDGETKLDLEPSLKHEYFPPDGVPGLCPAEPDGFERFIRRTTRSPYSTQQGEVERTVEFTYTALSSAGRKAILKASEKHASGSRATMKNTFEYDSSESGFGLLLSMSTEQGNNGGSGYRSVRKYKREVVGDQLRTTETYTAHDGKSVATTSEKSRFTGRVSRYVDANLNETLMEYDKAGRVLTERTVAATDYEKENYPGRSRTCTYETSADASASFIVTIRDFDGRSHRQKLDSAGRVTLEELLYFGKNTPSEGAWFAVKSHSYDAFGRPRETTSYDYAFNDDGTTTNIKRSAKHGYDEWGNECKREWDDGMVEHMLGDPVTRVQLTYQSADAESTGKKRVTVNENGKPVSIELVDSADKVIGRRSLEYDGWNRLTSDTADDRTRSYVYDDYDRVIQVKEADGTVVNWRFEAFSAEPLVAGMTVSGPVSSIGDAKAAGHAASETQLGTQKHDGLGRCTQSQSGGRTWSFSYADDAARKPNVVVDPAGRVRTYQYVPSLGEVTRSVEAGDIDQQFTYHPLTHALLTARAEAAAITRTYDVGGYLTQEKMEAGGKAGRTANYQWTLQGKLHSYEDVTGARTVYRFNESGRVTDIDDPAAKVTLNHDGFGRLTSWKTTDRSTTHTLETKLKFDDFSREIQREIVDSAHGKLSIKQEWLPSFQVSRRVTDFGGSAVRDETYEYDRKGRLQDYRCTGEHPPVDRYGNQLATQHFEHDIFDNIKLVASGFADGSSNESTLHYANADDPCQLSSVGNTHASYPSTLSYTYNRLGALEKGGAKPVEYDSLGRRKSLGTAAYSYDALNRLTGCGDTLIYYRDHQVMTEATGEDDARSVYSPDGTLLCQSISGTTWLIASDAHRSVLHFGTESQVRRHTYTPYGGCPLQGEREVSFGFNGQRLDQGDNTYHLGNGYRTYSPEMMHFLSPDGVSPFREGGANSYAYCSDDPVNLIDPTGQMGWRSIVGIVTSAVGIGMTLLTGGLALAVAGGVVGTIAALSTTLAGVASGVMSIVAIALDERGPSAATAVNALRFATLGLGLFSLAVGTWSIATALTSAIRELGIRASVATMGLASRINLGLVATSYVTGAISYGTTIARRVLGQTSAATSTAMNVLTEISLYTGLVSDVTSIAGFAHARLFRRAYSWDVPDDIPLADLNAPADFRRSYSWDLPQPGGMPTARQSVMPQLRTFYVFLSVPLRTSNDMV